MISNHLNDVAFIFNIPRIPACHYNAVLLVDSRWTVFVFPAQTALSGQGAVQKQAFTPLARDGTGATAS